MTQIRIVASDDLVEFEKMVNEELSLIGENYIDMEISSEMGEWTYVAIIFYEKEIE